MENSERINGVHRKTLVKEKKSDVEITEAISELKNQSTSNSSELKKNFNHSENASNEREECFSLENHQVPLPKQIENHKKITELSEEINNDHDQHLEALKTKCNVETSDEIKDPQKCSKFNGMFK